MKKKDWIILAVVLCIAGGIYISKFFFLNGTGEMVLVKMNGQQIGIYALNKNQTIQIGDGNVLTIKNGEAKMTDANCPDQICVHHTAIHNPADSIVCLPNKVVVEVINQKETKQPEKENDFDAKTN